MAINNDTTMQGIFPPAGFFDDIKAMFRETDKKFQETDLKMAENARQMAETDRIMQANARQLEELKMSLSRTEEVAKKALRGIGNIRNSIGALVEHLMTPDLTKKFKALGYTFTRFSRDTVLDDHAKNMLAEADMMLENGEYVLLVEVKTQLREEHVAAHSERMSIFGRHADEHGDKRKFLGAIAAPAIEGHLLQMVYDAGFYPITASEDSVEVHSPQGFKPKEW
jgi:predicted nuclease with TOPRIM domain